MICMWSTSFLYSVCVLINAFVVHRFSKDDNQSADWLTSLPRVEAPSPRSANVVSPPPVTSPPQSLPADHAKIGELQARVAALETSENGLKEQVQQLTKGE